MASGCTDFASVCTKMHDAREFVVKKHAPDAPADTRLTLVVTGPSGYVTKRKQESNLSRLKYSIQGGNDFSTKSCRNAPVERETTGRIPAAPRLPVLASRFSKV